MEFSDKIKEIRKERGISQEMLADALGVSRQAVGKWESGQGYPEVEKIIAISDMFDVSLDCLLKDTNVQRGHEHKDDQINEDEDENKADGYIRGEHLAQNTKVKRNCEDEEHYANPKIVESYLAYKKSSGRKIGAGVATIISSLTFLMSMGGTVGVALFLCGVGIGVAILVLQGFVPKQYWDDEMKYDILDPQFLRQYKISHQMITQRYGRFIAGGILLIFAGVIAAILGVVEVSPVFWGVGVYLFIVAAHALNASKNVVNNFKDLELGQFLEDEDSEEEGIADTLAELAILAYVAIGFFGRIWHPTWLIIPIAYLVGELFDKASKRKHNKSQS